MVNEHYYSKLRPIEKKYYRKFLRSIIVGDSYLLSPAFFPKESIISVAKAVNYDHPELFYVDFSRFSITQTSLGSSLAINYTVNSIKRKDRINEIEAIISVIIQESQNQMLRNEYERCRWIHNYLVRNTQYNYDALSHPELYPRSFGIEGALCDRLAVCEGISKTFKLLCDRLGVDSMVVSGMSSLSTICQEIPHAWNVVNLAGACCHVDVTWDIGMSATSKFTRFDYFCIPDKYIKADHEYANLPVCMTDAYNYFQKRNRWFDSWDKLQDYIDSEMKKRANVLYFKIEGEFKEIAGIQQMIQDRIRSSISKYNSGAYRIEMVPNPPQSVFFFRIIR